MLHARPCEISVEVSTTDGGVTYAQLLRHPDRDPVLGLLGVITGVVAYVVLSPLCIQAVLAVAWLLSSDLPWQEYLQSAARFEVPAGMLAGNLSIAVFILVAVALVRMVHRAPARALISVDLRVRWWWAAVCAGVAVVVFITSVVVGDVVSGGSAPWSPQAGFTAFLIVIVATTPLQAIAEEVFFRGYLMQAIGSMASSPWWGIVGSALLFAVFHGTQGLALFLSRFAFGLVAGWLVVRTGGLESVAAAHVVNNLFAWVLAAGRSSIAEVRAIEHITWVQAFTDVVAYAVIACVCAVVARRLRLSTRRASGVSGDATRV